MGNTIKLAESTYALMVTSLTWEEVADARKELNWKKTSIVSKRANFTQKNSPVASQNCVVKNLEREVILMQHRLRRRAWLRQQVMRIDSKDARDFFVAAVLGVEVPSGGHGANTNNDPCAQTYDINRYRLRQVTCIAESMLLAPPR